MLTLHEKMTVEPYPKLTNKLPSAKKKNITLTAQEQKMSLIP